MQALIANLGGLGSIWLSEWDLHDDGNGYGNKPKSVAFVLFTLLLHSVGHHTPMRVLISCRGSKEYVYVHMP